jgi:hypothetical protein
VGLGRLVVSRWMTPVAYQKALRDHLRDIIKSCGLTQ